MSKIVYITPDFAVAGQLAPEDFARAAEAGFKTIINNRPDGEERNQLNAEDGAEAAHEHGLAYTHIPATKHDIFTDETISQMTSALATATGPVLAHCKSGQRSAVLWAAASARGVPVQDVLDALTAAGIDLGFLRDELDRQHDRHRWSPQKPAAQRATPASPADRSVAVA